jgi:hypothetical protein
MQPLLPLLDVGQDLSNIPHWVKWFNERLGWTEFDHTKELAAGWKWTQVKSYKTVIGSAYAWCAMSLNTALEENGLHGTMSAGAASFEHYGQRCDFKLGAILPIRHASGRHHVTIFIKWKNEKKKLAYCLGGNQNNAINISIYNLSGNKYEKDQVMRGGPRWPISKKT